jgi:hypothetical protein
VERFWSRLWWVLPALSVVLGALLGAVNLNSPEASGGLRVPALLAALILVAQGMLDFANRLRDSKQEPTPEGRKPAPESGRPAITSGNPSVVHSDAVVIHESRVAAGGNVAVEQAQALERRGVVGTTVRESRGAVVAVLVLAIWLGLATLNYAGAPGSLLWLSLLASFLLFASAWSLLQPHTT